MAETGVVAGGALTDWISLGVLASSVPRDVVDDAVAVTGKGARRAGGKLPPHVMVYFVMALALFADEDYEEVAARLTETLRGWGCWDAGLGGADTGRDHPGPAAARPRAAGGGVLAGRGAGRGPGHGRGVPGAVAADVGGRDGVGRAGHGGEPGGVRVPGRLGGPGGVPEGPGGDGQRVRLARGGAGRDGPARAGRAAGSSPWPGSCSRGWRRTGC